MGKVVNMPKRPDSDHKVLHLQSYIRANIIDLTKQRKELLRMQADLKRLKTKLTLRLVKDDNGKKD